MPDRFATHEVFNQAPLFENVNLFTSDRVLREAVEREGAGAMAAQLSSFGAICGSASSFEQGRLANDYTPRLKTFDSKGRRLDIVEFHPAYHACMALSSAHGLHCSAWITSRRPVPRELRALTWRVPLRRTWPSRWKRVTNAR